MSARAVRALLVGASLLVPIGVVLALPQLWPPKAPPQWRVGEPYQFELRWGDSVFTVSGTVDECDCHEEPPRVAVK